MLNNSVLKLKKIHFIINPASGRIEPILPIINEAMKDAQIEWDISITKKAGDGTRLAQELLTKNVDLVAVYGGDGSIMEAITGLKGSRIPLAILPGGTGNVLATDLGIPGGLKEACELITKGPAELRAIDLGQFDQRYFSQRTSYGYETEMVKGAKRSTKNRFGRLAYVISSLGALRKIKIASYEIEVDGEKHRVKGVTCIVANTGNVGFSASLTLDKRIDISDGLLDIIVIRKVHISLLRYLYRIIVNGAPSDDHELVAHWQGKEIKVISKPLQAIQCDGEILERGPIHAKILPEAIQILVPRQEEKV